MAEKKIEEDVELSQLLARFDRRMEERGAREDAEQIEEREKLRQAYLERRRQAAIRSG